MSYLKKICLLFSASYEAGSEQSTSQRLSPIIFIVTFFFRNRNRFEEFNHLSEVTQPIAGRAGFCLPYNESFTRKYFSIIFPKSSVNIYIYEHSCICQHPHTML